MQEYIADARSILYEEAKGSWIALLICLRFLIKKWKVSIQKFCLQGNFFQFLGLCQMVHLLGLCQMVHLNTVMALFMPFHQL